MVYLINRRKMLAICASGILGMQVGDAAAISAHAPSLSRQIATWRDGLFSCWFMGCAVDVPQVIADAQEVMGDKALLQNLDFADLPRIFSFGTDRSRTPALVGCSTKLSLKEAGEEAFYRAYACGEFNDTKLIRECLFIVTGAVSQVNRLSEYRELRAWLKECLPADSVYLVHHIVGDDSLAAGSTRVSMAIGYGLPRSRPIEQEQMPLAAARLLDREIPSFLRAKSL
jgi:hypothetical protein